MAKKRLDEPEENLAEVSTDDGDETDESIADGFVLDIISGTKRLKDTPKEQVRQRIAHALWHEYGFSLDDMQSDFSVRVNGKRKKIDIAIFHAGKPKEQDNISRVVICRPEPKVGQAGIRIRDYDQAQKDLEELEDVMEVLDECKFGLWTNGLELFFLEKKDSDFQTDFEQIGDWPPSGESIGSRDTSDYARKIGRAHV